jgi:ADP-heptose:LPS heptosyltransferase
LRHPFFPGLLARLPFNPREVVLLRASRIGDFLCATPAFRALRAALPAARFTLIGQPFLRELVARCPYLDCFEPFPGYPGIGEQFFDPARTLLFFQRMRARQFDLAIQMHGSGLYSNPFARMLGAKVTVGFVRPGQGDDGLDAAFPFPAAGHEVHRNLALVEFLGPSLLGDYTEFPLWPEDHAAAEDLLRGLDAPWIGLHPGARQAEKRWPGTHAARVGSRLRSLVGGTVLVIGGPEDRATGDEIREIVGPGCLNLAGLPLPIMGALVARLAVLITTDSAPAHFAYALNTPSVTLFRATEPETWGPLEQDRHGVLSAEPEPVTVPRIVDEAQRVMRARTAAGYR